MNVILTIIIIMITKHIVIVMKPTLVVELWVFLSSCWQPLFAWLLLYGSYETPTQSLECIIMIIPILSLPSALARGSELRIYSHKVRMYVRIWWVTLRNVTRNVVAYMHPTQGHRYRPYVRHTVWICSTQISWLRTMAFFGDGDGGQEQWCGAAIMVWILGSARCGGVDYWV